jgi:hypothetical protein
MQGTVRPSDCRTLYHIKACPEFCGKNCGHGQIDGILLAKKTVSLDIIRLDFESPGCNKKWLAICHCIATLWSTHSITFSIIGQIMTPGPGSTQRSQDQARNNPQSQGQQSDRFSITEIFPPSTVSTTAPECCT